MKIYKALSIAGSDPSGGAGIQADLKAFSALGVYGSTAITAIVDENTLGVFGVHPVPISFVEGQIRSVLDDIGAHAIKIGMLHSSELIQSVRGVLKNYPTIPIVLDPVMVATAGGEKLLQDEAIETLKSELLPHVCLITPNIPEAELLLGEKLEFQSDLPLAAKKLAQLQSQKVSVFLKAGHLKEDELVDIFYNAETDQLIELPSVRIFTKNTHGTGCTLSSAITAFLARGFSLNEAAIRGKEYIYQAILSGSKLEIGKGNGPVHHFWNVENWGSDR